MRGYAAPWAVAGGWALDLALDVARRPHHDVDLATFRTDQAALRANFAGWRWSHVAGGVVHPSPVGASFALPIHELHATSPDGRSLEFLLNERDGDDWVFRRDARVRLPLADAIHESAAGLPVLAPAIVLLYKAKAPRPVDEMDFRDAAPHLAPSARSWLAAALALVHPAHPWQGMLDVPHA